MANQALALVDSSDAPAHINMDSSLGNENVGANITIPRLKQLQKMSNECDKHHPAYIKGAEPGMFCNTGTGELFGEEIYAISLNYNTSFKVWRAIEAGGGIVGEFDTQAEAEAAIDEAEGDNSNYSANETHTHLLILKDPKTGELSSPAVMDFAVSKLSVSKRWNTQIQMKGGDRFSALWKLSTVAVTSKAGNQYLNLDIEPVGWAQKADYDVAAELYKAHA